MKESVISVPYSDKSDDAIVDNACTCCLKNKLRVKRFQNIAVCSIVVGVVCLISNVLFNYTAWDKMNTLSNDNNELRSRIDDLARNLENLVALVQQQQGLADTQLISGTHSSEEDNMSAPLQQLLLHRNKRKANKERHKNKNRKKRCKNCLPVVQIEGTGGFSKQDKSDLSGFWKASTWSDSTAKFFDTKRVNQDGKLKVVKDGLYLLYAQLKLQGPTIAGMEILKQESSLSSTRTTPRLQTIAVCKRNRTVTNTRSETCFTMNVVNLRQNTEIFIREIDSNSSIQYLPTSNYLGLIKIGNYVE